MSPRVSVTIVRCARLWETVVEPDSPEILLHVCGLPKGHSGGCECSECENWPGIVHRRVGVQQTLEGI